MHEQLVITALGADRPGIVGELTNTLNANQLNIEDSRMSILGGEFAILMLVGGSSESIENITKKTDELEKQLNMRLLVKPTTSKSDDVVLAPYNVEVVSIDHPGIVNEIANFFSSRKINIVDLDTSRYPAAHTGTPMFALHMVIGVPPEQSITALRDEFITMCDELNLDAKMAAAS
jgi:glycine cleavage system transcriptional repressor